MALGPISIQPLQERDPIVDAERRAVPAFIRKLNQAFRLLVAANNETSDIVQQLAELAGIVDAQGDIIASQQTQIEELQTNQQQSSEALSLQNSGVTNEVASLTVNTGGLVSVPDHTRTYGDSALNPAVSVDGDTISTGQPADTIIYISYSDPSRIGGAVTYSWSVDSEALVQTGSNHAVGTVQVPASGTTSGDFVRPR